MNPNVKGVSLSEKLRQIDSYWRPKIIAELNGQQVKLAKLKGEFIWHQHDQEDELFLVIKGKLTIKLLDREITVREGELTVIPRGTPHLPVAEVEVHVLLFEPITTVNTGAVRNDRTSECEWI